MNGIVYHASKIEGLSELNPSKSQHKITHGKNFLYASSSKELAMFMSMRITDLYSVTDGQGTVENPAIFVERLPGIFDKYLHQPTNIYTLNAQDFYQGTSWQGEVITEKEQQILSSEYIPDVYSELEKLEKNGTVKLYHYPDRPPEIPKDNSDLIQSMMLPIYRSTQDLGIVRKMLQTYPKLFPKIIKSLITEKLNNLKKTISNKLQPTRKQKLLPSGSEKDHTKKDKSYVESLKVDYLTLEQQAENSKKFLKNTPSLDGSKNLQISSDKNLSR